MKKGEVCLTFVFFSVRLTGFTLPANLYSRILPVLTTDPQTTSYVLEYAGPDLTSDDLMTPLERLYYEYDLLNEVLTRCYEFLRHAYDTSPLMDMEYFVTTRDILGPRPPVRLTDTTEYLYNYWL